MNFTYRIDNEITLRLIEPRHAEELFAVVDANREALLPWMRWVSEVTDVQVLRDHIGLWLTQTAETGCMSLGIELDGELVGVVFHVRPDTVNKQVEVGYWLAKSARGRGAASRAVRAFIDITTRDLSFNRVNIRIAPQNTASLGVAERLGFKREGLSRQAWRVDETYYDAVEFGVLADEWQVTSPPFALTHRVDDEMELRLPEPRHAKELYELIDANREHIGRWMPWCTPQYALGDAETFIRDMLKGFAGGKGLTLWMVYQGGFVGGIGNQPVNTTDHSADIGYWLTESAQGNGVVTRAAREIVDYSLIDMGLNRVTIHAATENTRSAAVPKRLGFEQVGVKRQACALHGGHVDAVEYDMLAEDWQSQKAASRPDNLGRV